MADEPIIAEKGRLDVVLVKLTGLARADVQRAIAAGLVLVDGVPRGKSHRLAGGESLILAEAEGSVLQPEGPAVPVRYEDEHLLIVSKPAGIPTHPSANRRTGTLVNLLLGAGVELSSLGGPLRPGIVHRLDVGTSGLMLVAKTDEAHSALASMMKRHAVDRRYLALVRGAVAGGAFSVDAPLGRRAARIVIDQTQGRDAQTSFLVRERLPSSTLLEAAPRTGRTHQIRVHLAGIGHPILGDRAYGGASELAREIGLGRPFLHSFLIGFEHPLTGQRIERREPLPPELAEALERARTDQRP